MGLTDEKDDKPADRYGNGETYQAVVERRLLTRRDTLRVGVALTGLALAGGATTLLQAVAPDSAAAATVAATTPGVRFTPIRPNTTDTITIPQGYAHQVVHRWGDPLFPGIREFDVDAMTPELQERTAGYNHDFVYFLPLPIGSDQSTDAREGLLWTNHEYTDGAMMFRDYDPANPTAQQVAIELAAHGATVVHVIKDADGLWTIDRGSHYNRRITANTPMRISGPAAGAEWMRTSEDPSGRHVLGMLNNCGGGVTPWGTILTCEENFHQYFGNAGQLAQNDARKAVHARYGVPSGASERSWERLHARFDVANEPNEAFRFGWVVEIDPYNPNSQPIKHTALGRFKHEAATCALAEDGRVVVYSGDDERFDYMYKFVSRRPFTSNERGRNSTLLDDGTLYAAKLNDDGTGTWLRLEYGVGPLVPPAFLSQADVLIRTRQAADLVGATKMDRPEDVEANPVNGKVYAAMTNNTQRGTSGRPGTDGANPRARNAFGHVIELSEANGDFAATTFTWEIFILAGDPSDPSTYFAGFPKNQVSTIANPDNLTFDGEGNLWIATDGQPSSLGLNDGIYGVPVEGPERGFVKQLLSAVRGAEVASLAFTPDSRTVFAAIQHPGEGGSIADPDSTWPGGPGTLARPAVVAVWREDGKVVAG